MSLKQIQTTRFGNISLGGGGLDETQVRAVVEDELLIGNPVTSNILSVGTLTDKNYTFPSGEPFERQIQVSGNQFTNFEIVTGENDLIVISFPALAPPVHQTTVPAGSYSLNQLVNYIKTDISNYLLSVPSASIFDITISENTLTLTSSTESFVISPTELSYLLGGSLTLSLTGTSLTFPQPALNRVVSIVGDNNKFVISITATFPPSLTDFVIPQTNYTVFNLLIAMEDSFNARLVLGGVTNTVTFQMVNGKIRLNLSTGNRAKVVISGALFGWKYLGAEQIATIDVLAGTSYDFLNEPPYETIDITPMSWTDYNFNQTGRIFTGDMEITGSLVVDGVLTTADKYLQQAPIGSSDVGTLSLYANNDGFFHAVDDAGNDTSLGSVTVPNDIDINSVCAVTGTFQNLGVGLCGAPVYKLPTGIVDNKYSGGVIVSRGGTLTLIGRDAIFEIVYSVGTTSYTRNTTLTDGDYSVQTVLSLVQNALNSQLELDGATNRITLSIDKNGFVVYRYTLGNSPFISLSIVGGDGWERLGSLGVTILPPDTNNVFGALPEYSDPSHNTVWGGYNFDDSGSIYNGNMTITGSLSVNTLISDIEVEDAIITLNKNGFADANNSGVLINGSNNTKFSGLIKNKDSNNFYLFANSNTQPTQSVWVPEQTGNLYLNNLSVNTDANSGLLTVESSGVNDTPLYAKGAVGQTADLLRVVNNADVSMMSVSSDGRITTTGGLTTTGQLETLTGIRTGLSGVEYILPSARGTLGQVMTSDGAGNVLFQDVPVATSLISPSGNSSIFVDDFETATQVNGIIRFKSDSGETRINSPNTNTNIILQSGGIDFSVAGSTLPLSITSATTTIRGGPANTTFSTYQDASYQLNNGGQVRMLTDGTETSLYSPDGVSSSHSITDDAQVLNVGGDDRLVMDATLTTLTNATGATFLELGDTTSRLSFGGVDALSLIPLVTTIRGGPSGFSELQLGGPVFGLDYRYGSQQRIKISGPASQIFAPDGQGEFDIRNDRALTVVNGITRQELSASTTTIRDENNIERIVADSGNTRLNAPTGSNKLTVSSSAVEADGRFVVQTTDPAQVQIRSNAPLGQVASLQQWQINFATVAQIDQQGNGAFNNMFLINNNPSGTVISNLAGVPMTIGPSTHSKLNIGYAGAPTTINGAVDVPNGLTIGATPNKYAFPLVAGAEGQHLEVNATGDLAYTYGQIFATIQANATTAMTLALQNTYYPLPNATINAQVGGFTFGPLGLATYNGAYPLFLRVGAHCSIERSSAGGSEVFSFSVLKNGAVATSIGECRAKFDDTGTFPLEVSFEGVVAVVNGDTLQLAVANEDSAATTANVYSYSFLINKI